MAALALPASAASTTERMSLLPARPLSPDWRVSRESRAPRGPPAPPRKTREDRSRAPARGARAEAGHLRQLRPLPRNRAEAEHGCRIMQRRQRVQPFNGPDDLVVDQHGLGETLPAVHHAVADGVEPTVPQCLVNGGVHLLQGLRM